MKEIFAILILLFNLFVGLFMVLMCLSALRRRARLNSCGVVVRGVVKERGTDEDNDPWVIIGYQYAETDYVLQAFFHNGTVGAPVAVLVDPDNPTEATCFGTVRGGCMPVVFLVCGLMMIVVCVATIGMIVSRAS